MKKGIILILILASTHIYGQKFKSYQAYGLQANVVIGAISAAPYDLPYPYESINTDLAGDFDLIVNYDLGLTKWFGLGSGIGISSRSVNSPRDQYKLNKNLYYLNIPVKLQLKMGFFWLEPGIENRIFLFVKDKSLPANQEEDFMSPSDINIYNLAGTIGGRFNLFRGLSLNLGFGLSLTDIARHRLEFQPQTTVSFNNMNYFLGVRYMINQPY